MSAAPSLHLVPPAETEPDTRSESFGREPLGPEPLWREVVGARLRHLRRRHGLTLVEAATRAGISPQYLSEVERGRKDPSSEVLAAITGALGEQLVDVTHLATLDLRRQHSGLAAPPPGEIRLSA
ncbi:helix-turn-helix domain-containing protein [Phycicoccus sp. Soil802]|uniref:helix-turn-helix domain-containing protein n=1 Tax=Phycicoccus sp. Soil802 TaxID=1736414 RepID=UPI0009E6C1B1|nr:helix-turn-helix transcriptional regulator [Phycicoccus sp. Soil802]